MTTVAASQGTRNEDLKVLLKGQDPGFWRLLQERTQAAASFDEVLSLSTLRRRAHKLGLAGHPPLATARWAVLGGCSLYPLHELVQHFLESAPQGCVEVQYFLGDYDNYTAEILEPDSPLYEFRPDLILVLPSPRQCRYQGNLYDPREQQLQQAQQTARQLLELCRMAWQQSKAEIVLANFPLPCGFDPGPYRVRTLGSDWTFRKQVNLELGLNAPPYVHVCDVEFLAARRGTLASTDERAWFESKQMGSPDLLMDIAREVAHIGLSLRGQPKKVAVLDLDNTLWGGVIGDDGLEGIDIGDTSPRGEAFKAFQQYLLSLSERGVLLAVCSKNDEDKAWEPFDSHPEMVLRRKHFVSFKANWEPKSENIRAIAQELNLGLDSFVFIDDNPAEIEIVRQFVPEVTGLLLGPDPSRYAAEVQDARLFEPRSITAEDAERGESYVQEVKRQSLQSTFTDIGAYLESLEMKGSLCEFRAVDVPRIAQLIGRSNQFNLTTHRRTEAEVGEVLADPACRAFNIRLEDRFGDYGLIAVVIGRIAGREFEIDTWLMSCRVLKRQVEEETVNEMVRLAALEGCDNIRGLYLPTKKNGMVRDLYPKMGFTVTRDAEDRREFRLDVLGYTPKETRIHIVRRSYDAN